MPQAVSLVLANATPTNLTFVPIGPDRATGQFVFEEQSSGNAVGFPTLTYSHKRSTDVRRNKRVLYLPVTGLVDGKMVVLEYARITTEVVMSKGFDATNQGHLKALQASVAAKADDASALYGSAPWF